MTDLDPRAIARGAAVAAAVALPAAVLANLAAEGSSLRPLLLLVTLAGFGLGGFVAGRAVPRRALTHGGLAAAAGYLAVLVLSVVVQAARGESVNLAAIPLRALISLSSGVLGGYVAHQQATKEEVGS